MRAAFGHRVRIHARRDRVGEQLLHHRLEPLRADAEFVHALVLARRADLGSTQFVAAPVAHEATAAAVPRHRHRAVLALHGFAATRAQQHWRVAAAVQEQQHLVARAQPLLHQQLQRARQHDAGTSLLLRLAAKVLHDDLGQRAGACALLQRQQLIDAATRLADGLQRRRRRTEHDGSALDLAARDRHLARVVARRAVLLERRLVLFVEDDEAEVLQRREQRRTRADCDARLALQQALPLAAALRVGEAAVQHRDIGETRREATDRLRRQRDLGHEHDAGAAARADFFEDAKVDLGLAAAGDAVQQERAMHARLDRRRDLVDGLLLLLVEHVAHRCFVERWFQFTQLFGDEHAAQEPVLDQGLPRTVAGAGAALHFERGHRCAELEHGAQHARLLLVLLLQLRDRCDCEVARRLHFEARDATLATLLRDRGQRRVESLAERAAVAVRHALAEAHQAVGQQQIRVEDLLDGSHLLRRQIARVADRDDDAAELAAVELHEHAIAGPRRCTFWQRVGELAAQRQVERDLHVAAGRSRLEWQYGLAHR